MQTNSLKDAYSKSHRGRSALDGGKPYESSSLHAVNLGDGPSILRRLSEELRRRRIIASDFMKSCDTNSTNDKLSLGELERGLNSVSIWPEMKPLREMFRLLDSDGDRRVSFKELEKVNLELLNS